MRKIFTLLVALIAVSVVMAQQPLRYVDATELTILGQAMPTGKPYDRVNTQKYKLPEDLLTYSTFSTGLHIVFRTDSRTIAARWSSSQRTCQNNLTPNAQKGLDLYIMRDGEWVWAGVGSPRMRDTHDKHSTTLTKQMPEGEKLCLLYLPLFDRIDKMEIGIDEGSSIEAAENPFRHKIVVHGSSITHGVAASRSGMLYSGLLSRRTGFYSVNLGYSGRSKLQEEMAHFLADIADADAFLFDTFSNPSAELIEERFDKFVDIIRAKHPTTPLIFTQTICRESRNFQLDKEDFESRKQAAAERVVRRRMKSDKHIYFLDSKGWLGDDHLATGDGVHPTDLGFVRMIDHIEPAVVKILKKYGIK